MASSKKVEENKPPLIFNFTYLEVFSDYFVDSRMGLGTCLIFRLVRLSGMKVIYRLYTGCNRALYMLYTGLKTPPSR